MRAGLSEQDLTDYALNELEADQRLYVESMLAASEECRHDVCEMIEMAMLLEESFEREERKTNAAVVAELTPEQRQALLVVKPKPRYLQKFAAVLAAAAAVAFCITNPTFWKLDGKARQIASVSTQFSTQMVNAVTAEEPADFVAALSNWTQLAEDPVLKKWFSSEWFSGEGSVDASVFSNSMPSSIQHTSFEMMP